MFNTPNEAIAYALLASRALFHRHVDDLKPHEFEHQPWDGVNSAAWIVGHLAVVDRRIATGLGATDLPALPPGFEEKFATTRTRAGAQSGFGDPKELIALFDTYRDRLIETVLAADPAKFAEPAASVSGMFTDRGEAGLFMGIHTAMHLGQITVIRRSLGYAPSI